ncbi:hypothetical protein [Falsibacillus pallidus]|uniref:Uncharacterized protein n=1 Tax=Falsibacillus pallidus TaxID=493781 RepID=A0A370G2V5_9BACI|nr:hypothetical protein [Falsibacillus pallidus]RDI38042.1 hypothetical protein DFR59_11954 [Falsibacillus pallidus]
MSKRRKYSSKELKRISLLYFIIGGFLIVSNITIFLLEGRTKVIFIAPLSGILFIIGGIIFRVRAAKLENNQS